MRHMIGARLRTALLAIAACLGGVSADAAPLLAKPPAGLCQVTKPLTPEDSAAVRRLDGGPSDIVRIKAVYVDCPSLPLLAGKGFGAAKRLAVLSAGTSAEPIKSRKDFIDSFANNYVIERRELMARLDGAVDAYAARYATDPAYGRDQPMNLGIVDRDGHAIYKAGIMNLTVRGKGRIYASVNALTVTGQTIVRISMHAPHRRNTVYGELLEAVRGTVLGIDDAAGKKS